MEHIAHGCIVGRHQCAYRINRCGHLPRTLSVDQRIGHGKLYEGLHGLRPFLAADRGVEVFPSIGRHRLGIGEVGHADISRAGFGSRPRMETWQHSQEDNKYVLHKQGLSMSLKQKKSQDSSTRLSSNP